MAKRYGIILGALLVASGFATVTAPGLSTQQGIDRRRGSFAGSSHGRLACGFTLGDLDLSFCEQLTDSDLEHVAGIKSLQSLDLSHTQVSDVSLRELAVLPQLRKLVLASCEKLTDAGSGLNRLTLPLYPRSRGLRDRSTTIRITPS